MIYKTYSYRTPQGTFRTSNLRLILYARFSNIKLPLCYDLEH
uniref:Uncharacterized protein n=1 Tax=Arundo donax TaxID=35708 RepID=A0A0A8YC14_ARUDO